MEEFKIDVWNSLYYQGNYIATEINASNVGCRKWVAVYPLNEIDSLKGKYTILEFELNEELVDEYFTEDDKLNQRRYYVKNEEELITTLKELNIPLFSFTYPWKCDYPL